MSSDLDTPATPDSDAEYYGNGPCPSCDGPQGCLRRYGHAGRCQFTGVPPQPVLRGIDRRTGEEIEVDNPAF